MGRTQQDTTKIKKKKTLANNYCTSYTPILINNSSPSCEEGTTCPFVCKWKNTEAACLSNNKDLTGGPAADLVQPSRVG